MALTIQITPHGQMRLVDADTPDIEPGVTDRVRDAFSRGVGHGLLQLGAAEVETALPVALAYWRDFAVRYVTAACSAPAPDPGAVQPVEVPASDALDALVAAAPPMTGIEYLTAEVLAGLWRALDAALQDELALARQSLQAFLHERHPGWSVVGRVHFNLAEYRLDPETPFAFLATYTASLSARGKVQHAPLGRALQEYAGARNKPRLLSLLVPVQRGAEACAWLKQMVDAGDVFHPLRWTPAEAYRFLQDVPALESAGIIVRLPAAWKSGRPSRPRATATIGTKTPSGLGTEALLDFQMSVTLDGVPLTRQQIDELLAGADGLRFLRGQWVEVQRDTLQRMIDEFARLEGVAAERGITFAEAMRVATGAALDDRRAGAGDDRDWSEVTAGPWLAEVLAGLRGPEGLARVATDGRLQATLRPYQDAGVRWLRLLSSLGLGACLADDMGLGKTLQVLTLLVARRRTPRRRATGARRGASVAPGQLGRRGRAVHAFAAGRSSRTRRP